ncbi:MBL fold metallo-hydrolase [Streptomyces sp. NBC_01808]|uniref:alkyl/aryl-sulfatase n=1 Tax=Streptomyces sp. NBC_01808 TaxID=2975947 RepID=UPI002DDA8A93|nr:alkyl sulfatase dimerization domain-containing protein [Streptomyces sp. NBC_01808]WSA36127.1 MBL fold metallo-hydrolase [Streptomyces sp. NBC_01808]
MATPDPSDRADFEAADRGFLAGPVERRVTAADGRVVWDFDDTAFLGSLPDGNHPDTVDPSLWRQAKLCARAGLYEVAEGVLQVRGYDLSNMTLIEGDQGVVVVDPLISRETAAAALALYRAQRGDRPVTGVVITHSHLDHFGGILGVLDPDADVPAIAPAGYLEHAVAENVYAGTAMLRRGFYYGGMNLDRGPAGLVGMGLGFTASTGTPALLPATIDVTHTGQTETVDGVRFVFQMTPGTEAPSEMNFLLPDHRALCMAENATHNLHNILTLRGALVRDARVWARYLDEALRLFAAGADVLFASHHWPTWGQQAMRDFLTEQRDLYAYLHDQTLRLANQGYTGAEIAEIIEMPPSLAAAWHTHGYYGTVSHNVKAIYQRYLGWYDGHPASLWEHPPAETAKRYAECMGGVDALVAKAGAYAEDGDLRFAAQLLKHAVFADPDHTGAKNTLADVFERLGHGAECATWRNCYLVGARELREGVSRTDIAASSMMAALSVEQLLDSVAIVVDGPRAWDLRLTLDWHVTDLGEHHRATLSHGALTHHHLDGHPAEPADVSLTLTKAQLLALLAGEDPEDIEHTGDLGVLRTLLSVLDKPDPDFAVVTP